VGSAVGKITVLRGCSLSLRPSKYRSIRPRHSASTARLIVEQREIVDVAHVLRAQHLAHPMVEPVEVQVGEELAREVADRQS
jgi:hypothetical protein